jgi:NAD(P)H-hydrate epimerase
MAAMAAMRCGAGLVTVGVPSSLNPGMETQLLEAMTAPLPEAHDGCLGEAAFDAIMRLLEGKQALALGPGIGTDPSTRNLVCRLLTACELPIVLDADGLNCLASNLEALEQRQAPLVMTPHPGEMARLLNTSPQAVQQDRIRAARQLTSAYPFVLVLKGARTLIAHPDGRVYVNPTGNAGMASGGMGDVLTGLIAGLIVQGVSPANAAQAGVYLHGLAADTLAARMGSIGFLASDVMHALPETIQHLAGGNPGNLAIIEPEL